MAKKAESFKVIAKTKTIILYTNVEQNDAEKTLIEFYLNNGYTPKFEEKKEGKSVEDMRKEMKDDVETLKNFNDTYGNKEDKKAFFNACKIYTKWVKDKKAKEKAEAEAKAKAEAK